MNWLAPVSALIFYGSWSAWLNLNDSNPVWLLSGISHGLYAFLFTLIFRGTTRTLFRRLYQLRSHYKKSQCITFLLMSLVITLVPIVNQSLAGNVQIGMTILPGVIMGHVYLLLVLNYELPTRDFDKSRIFCKQASASTSKQDCV